MPITIHHPSRRELWAVYTLTPPMFPDTAIWIGYQPLMRLFELRDAMADHVISERLNNEAINVNICAIVDNEAMAEQSARSMVDIITRITWQTRHPWVPDRLKGRDTTPVIEITTDREFASAAEAARMLGLDPSQVSKCLRKVPHYKRVGKQKYRFKYADELE